MCQNVARGSIAGESLVRVLEDLHHEGRILADDVELIMEAFDDAFALELSEGLPRSWRLDLRGRLRRYNIIGDTMLLNVSNVSATAFGAAFYNVQHLEFAAIRHLRADGLSSD
eukprot:CAMPEP_0117506556 /NCGR_PEP_ID=MMETSP0784-20121206/25968_1 /TAXON_ID=39447 /ORGANISM="" /LENGTH=112 /DNA_ID=CAMNT_0005302031 /DNA_START=117 /DNA_END=453 /DNA_ORIENTATION=+